MYSHEFSADAFKVFDTHLHVRQGHNAQVSESEETVKG